MAEADEANKASAEWGFDEEDLDFDDEELAEVERAAKEEKERGAEEDEGEVDSGSVIGSDDFGDDARGEFVDDLSRQDLKKLPSVPGDRATVFYQGWLKKLGGGKEVGRMEGQTLARKNWKYRWFVLRDTMLKYYKRPVKAGSPLKALGYVPLTADTLIQHDAMERNCFQIATKNRTFFLVGKNQQVVSAWLASLQEACNRAELDSLSF
eukprot:m.125263 g.125263  ORF g.125263 m.125263 type:complete len:209 (+) comp16649_c0_seq1:4722-5348(+)